MSRHPRSTIAVVGGGVMGSAAAWQLALRGHRVVLLEQYGPGHARGASHGTSRIFRHAYVDRRYVNLAARSARLWRTLERTDGSRFLTRTGAVDHGDPAALQPLARALADAGLEHALLAPRSASDLWPGIQFDTMVLHHPDAGRLHADDAVAALQRRALAEGAEVWHHSPVAGLRVNSSGVLLLTASGSIKVDQVVVAAGAWTSRLLSSASGFSGHLPALRTTQEQPAHFAPLEADVNWPSFIHHPGAEYTGSGIYGLGSVDGIKIGEHGTGPHIEPESRDFRPEPEAVQRLQRYAARWLPGVDPCSAKPLTCLYTTTPDHHFVVDRQGPVTVAAGFSGHGFKFAPAIGELVAGLVNGTADAPDLFRLGNRQQPVHAAAGRNG